MGISLGLQEYGYALFRNTEYCEGQVKSLKKHIDVEAKCQAFEEQVDRIIEQELPTQIVWEKPTHSHQQTKRFRALEQTLLRLVRKHKFLNKNYTGDAVKAICSGRGQKPNRENLCRHLATVYPALAVDLRPYQAGNGHGWKYWLHLFNAVGVVHTHLHQEQAKLSTATYT